MAEIFLICDPFDQDMAALALEKGVDGLFVPDAEVANLRSMSRCPILPLSSHKSVTLDNQEDTQNLLKRLQNGERISLAKGWEIIPVENLLAQNLSLNIKIGVIATNFEEAKLAKGILERGVDYIDLLPEAMPELSQIIAHCKQSQGTFKLQEAIIQDIQLSGLGHRVCVDTTSVLQAGQGMLVGDSSAFCFLVHAETEFSPHVNARPFRVNAGAVHAYTHLANDRTCYLEELKSGAEVLIVNHKGETTIATVGRSKVEVRPMLLITAECNGKKGSIFLQNAETIRLTKADGKNISVTDLKPGDAVLCYLDNAGRHFGMRVEETIQEIKAETSGN